MLFRSEVHPELESVRAAGRRLRLRDLLGRPERNDAAPDGLAVSVEVPFIVEVKGAEPMSAAVIDDDPAIVADNCAVVPPVGTLPAKGRLANGYNPSTCLNYRIVFQAKIAVLVSRSRVISASQQMLKSSPAAP